MMEFRHMKMASRSSGVGDRMSETLRTLRFVLLGDLTGDISVLARYAAYAGCILTNLYFDEH